MSGGTSKKATGRIVGINFEEQALDISFFEGLTGSIKGGAGSGGAIAARAAWTSALVIRADWQLTKKIVSAVNKTAVSSLRKLLPLCICPLLYVPGFNQGFLKPFGPFFYLSVRFLQVS